MMLLKIRFRLLATREAKALSRAFKNAEVCAERGPVKIDSYGEIRVDGVYLFRIGPFPYALVSTLQLLEIWRVRNELWSDVQIALRDKNITCNMEIEEMREALQTASTQRTLLSPVEEYPGHFSLPNTSDVLPRRGA